MCIRDSISFSPVLDVNNNAANPVINDRSFGEDRELVAQKAVSYTHLRAHETVLEIVCRLLLETTNNLSPYHTPIVHTRLTHIYREA